MDSTNAQIFDPWLVCYLLPIPLYTPNANIQIVSRSPYPTPSPVHYSFLSYGLPTPESIEIDFDGDLKPIPANLERLLRVLAPTQGARAIYADAVAWLRPDAPDLVSRYHVTRAYAMRANYTRCWPGFWLSPETSLTAQAIDLLGKAAQEWDPLGTIEDNMNRLKHHRIDGIELYHKDVYYEIYNLLRSSYWSHIICVLDNVKSETTTLYFGSLHLGLGQYIQGYQALQYLRDVENRPPRTDRFFLIEAIYRANLTYKRRGQPILDELLRMAMRFPRANPREVVFDMIPLVPHMEHQLHVGHNIIHLFTEAARAIVDESGICELWEHAIDRWNNAVTAQNNDWAVRAMGVTLMARYQFLDTIEFVTPIITASNVGRICDEEWQRIHNADLCGAYDRSRKSLIFAKTLALGCTHNNEFAELEGPSRDATLLESLHSFTEDHRRKWPQLVTPPRQQVVSGEIFKHVLHQNSLGRRLFRTKSGTIGMTAVEDVSTHTVSSVGGTELPVINKRYTHNENLFEEIVEGVRPGDHIAAIVSGYTSYVLRARGELNHYTFVGECSLYDTGKRIQATKSDFDWEKLIYIM
ncbi:hypothetical protein F4678DRAFT_455397 [Xylaria arbuscula]|nr:hypothetical protein F4678DRAFT_455397 [Xylaria arbuscula]